MARTSKHRRKKDSRNAPPPRRRRPNLRTISRRGFLTLLALSIPGLLIGLEWRRRAARHDISLIGEGVPVVVQVHDNNCPECRRLRANVKEALEAIDDGLEYRIVDINTTEGARFAARHGVSHVTILLFDGAGRRQQIIEGVTEVAELGRAFRRLRRRG